MWSGHTGCVRTRNRTEKVTDQKPSKLRVVGTRKIADLPRDTSDAASIETCAEDVDETLDYKPSEYALHLAHPDLRATIGAFKASGRNALVISRSAKEWSTATSFFCEKFLENSDFILSRNNRRVVCAGLRDVLVRLGNGDAILIADPDEFREPIFQRLACATVDASCVNSGIMTRVLRHRFGGDVTWPSGLEPLGYDPAHIDAAFANATTADEAIELLRAIYTHEAVEDEKSRKDDEKSKTGDAWPPKSKAKHNVEILRPLTPKLDDLSGYGAAADWCRDLIEDLDAYRAGDLAWSDVDTGCLLVGPPGTGKTLLASALAATAGLPLIATSFAQWSAKASGYQSDTIKAMRQTFEAAAQESPIILFIDEIDAIPARGVSKDHDDYWRPIVTGLLELMDGTNRTEGVVVIAACNHADGLDPALVRSGRLDRRFDIELPDEAALTQIIAYHVPEASPADIAPIATALAGTVSGADIARIAREAKRAARRAGRQVTAAEILAAALPAETRPRDVLWRTAVHEAGHAVGYLVAGQVPRALSLVLSDGVAGYVQSPATAASQQRIGDLEARVLPMLMGRAAEDVLLGEASAGAVSDLEAASQILAAVEGGLGLGGYLTPGGPDRAGVEIRIRRIYGDAILIAIRHRADIADLARLAIEKRVLGETALRDFATSRGLI